MKAWLDLISGLFLFRRGPADVPYAPTTLVVLFVAMILIDAAAGRALTGQSGDTLLVLLNNGISLLLVHAVLTLHAKPARFVQTATALLLIRISLSLLMLAVFAGVLPLPQRPEDLRAPQALLISLMFPLILWYLALRVHVLRQALDITVARAISLVILIASVEFLIGISLVLAFK